MWNSHLVSFSAALESVRLAGDGGDARVPEGWAQGRATFGGLVVGLALRALRLRLPQERPCRSLVASFPGPIGPGDVALSLSELRHGRAVSHMQAEVRQEGVIGCVLLASFGAARESALVVPPPAPPTAPTPETLPPLVSPATAPEFTHHLDYRLALGAPPYSASSVRELGGWCRFRDDPGPLGAEHVLALVDAWPSPAVSHMAAPSPAASITWALDLLEVEPGVATDGWWLYRAEIDAAGSGYVQAAAALWSPGGRLAALSRQAVAVFS